MSDRTLTHLPVTDGEELNRVAALIRPLPQDVMPSDEFLRRMRGRLLELNGYTGNSVNQAA